ncbi:MAG: (5-formylfuran-3-yl)methyl phosphate synthase [Candidatus Jordarchaeum sp.]|uniref:(5-formylfuran-3-yl)methyl phosphate synthase n=1 Tax=Candidatus Jordarchaeum sp. TaxID=2823881 RepID=UPI004049738B
MKLLISPKDVEEALEAIAGGADIIDVKNPLEGSLGANFPWVIRRIREITPKKLEVSAAIGDFPNNPGMASLAALGAAASGADYVKVGLFGAKIFEDALHLSKHVVRSVKEYDPRIKVVIAGYADAHRINSIDPFLIPQVTSEAGADVAMIDTAIKDGTGLLDLWALKRIENFVQDGHERNVMVALAGSLKKEDIPTLYNLDADVVGIRGAACEKSNRLEGKIVRERVQELVSILNSVVKSQKL